MFAGIFVLYTGLSGDVYVADQAEWSPTGGAGKGRGRVLGMCPGCECASSKAARAYAGTGVSMPPGCRHPFYLDRQVVKYNVAIQ